jgi:hypothetical protein
MGTKIKAIGYAQAQEALVRYWHTSPTGKRTVSVEELASEYDVSYTTMYRIVNRQGPYRKLNRPLSQAEIEMNAAEAVRLMKERFAGAIEAEKEKDQTAERLLTEMVQAPIDRDALAERLAAVQAAKGEDAAPVPDPGYPGD